jgi:hypothetical protein
MTAITYRFVCALNSTGWPWLQCTALNQSRSCTCMHANTPMYVLLCPPYQIHKLTPMGGLLQAWAPRDVGAHSTGTQRWHAVPNTLQQGPRGRQCTRGTQRRARAQHKHKWTTPLVWDYEQGPAQQSALPACMASHQCGATQNPSNTQSSSLIPDTHTSLITLPYTAEPTATQRSADTCCCEQHHMQQTHDSHIALHAAASVHAAPASPT